MTLIHELSHGGSGPNGLSSQMQWLKCPRAAWLNEHMTEEERALEDMKDNARTVGRIGHAYMELFFNKKLRPKTEVLFGQTGHPNEASRLKAERTCAAFFERLGYDPGALGKVVGTEVPVKLESLGLTGRVDLVTRPTQKQIGLLQKRFLFDGELAELRPGTWLWDYKFLGGLRPNAQDAALGRLQYIAYPLMYCCCRGMIQVALTTTKNPEFRFTVVSFPSQRKVQILDAALQAVEYVKIGYDGDRAPPPWPSDEQCYPYGEICSWFGNGCQRY